ncbi:replication initiation protein [Melaminivora suipulveris]|uniref:Replication initiation protein n=1 Tax=Melaminivora suipulveris TaxID=2109913 RepID=A0A2R3Q8L3_9BURK|nr:replication initiation factor domain-containing protein [Melaminivora suipulveris]AVO48126.1 replication initiation protein [Melaminivora suipulveris]
MTRPARSVLKKHSQTCALVLDGNEVKARLLAERTNTNTMVHVDWLRFTCLLRNAPTLDVETLFPSPLQYSDEQHAADRHARLIKLLGTLPDAEFAPSAQAMELAQRVCETLGEEFTVAAEVRKGHDFYRHRWSIERNGQEVGWVGYLASGDSPRQQAQAKTMHVNLYGTACTFARSGWREDLATLVDEMAGNITRCDLALDFFDGLAGGMARIVSDYETGLMDSGGKRLKCNMVGDWSEGGRKGRSFYVGSKEAGKQTNIYEKGAQLFGEKDATDWMRAELRYGNKLRHLPSDILRRPADFFGGASDWHAALLREAEATATPERIPTARRLPAETIEAEVTRNVRWLRDVAAPSLALAFEHLGESAFLSLVEHQQTPGRLRRFTRTEVARAYASAHRRTTKGAGAGHATA